MENEKIYLRKILLDTMDTYVRTIVSDEEIFQRWIDHVLPDGYDDDQLTEYAEDDNLFYHACNVFREMMKERGYGV